MSLSGLLVHEVTILRPAATTDRYRNTIKDWANATRTTSRAWVSRSGASEDRDRREAQVSDWLVYLPANTDITGADRVEWGDITFEVDGPPNPAGTPRGAHHIEAQLRVVDG